MLSDRVEKLGLLPHNKHLCLCRIQLRACARADDDNISLVRHGAADGGSSRNCGGVGLRTRHLLQRAREDDDLADERHHFSSWSPY